MKKYLPILAGLLIASIGCAQPTPAGGAPAASQAEVNAGTVANKYVSPLTLDNWSGGGGGGSGTVTSVSFTGGLISVGDPTAAAALTVAGTSGGIPYFSSASTWATSAALAANSLVIGGGAGVAPSTTTTGANILTFLGTPSSANLAAAVTGETGSGALVFATSPALVTPDIGAATGTSLVLTGSVTAGSGGGVAGVLELGQGTAPSDGTTSVKLYADTAVTSYKRKLMASVGSTGYVKLTVSGTTQTESTVGALEKIAVFVIDGGGSAITTATVAGTSMCDVGYTLVGYSISGTAATGTNTIKIWNKAYSTAIPTIANVINTSGVSLSSGTSVYSTTISDFTDTTFAAQDQFRCAVTAVDGTATDLTVTLYGTRL